jgi:CobQ-like glutamine amidotransferase family enzyme
MKINIAYLYPELLNIYGDKGNILSFVNRCLWRNIEVNLQEINIGEKINPDLYDFYFIGGGQDEQQIAVAQELQTQKSALIQARDNMAVFLAICGGYQLLGHYYQPHNGNKLEGISLLDAYTIAGNTRYIGNVTAKLNEAIINDKKEREKLSLVETQQNIMDRLPCRLCESSDNNDTMIVGFENHSGLTYIEGHTKSLGIITVGNGNNGKDKTEGAFYKNVFGTYLHGSFLPKNPHFADYLITLALERNYGKVQLEPLNDEIEFAAHKKALGRKY